MKADIHTVVIAKPGHYRTSLIALLATIPQISSVKTMDDVHHVLEGAAGPVPDLVLMETYTLNQSSVELMGSVRELWPNARRIIVAERILQPKPAGPFGADIVLTKDVSTGEFLRLVEQLLVSLPQPGRAWQSQ